MRKSFFCPELGKKKMLRGIKSADWISKVQLLETREHQIRQGFSYACVEFHYPNDIVEFETVLDLSKDHKTNVNIKNDFNDLGESDVFDWLIVMDDVAF